LECGSPLPLRTAKNPERTLPAEDLPQIDAQDSFPSTPFAVGGNSIRAF
jgi:hypothetical protein